MTEKIPLVRLNELVGAELSPSPWFVVDQASIDAFARCTGDDQWLHVDVERAARESPFGGTVAHGYLTLALVGPASLEVLRARVAIAHALNYGLERVRFIAPVRAGKRVRNRLSVSAVTERGPGRWLATTENTMEIEGEARPALVATALVLVG
jgi:acyl dehydratase